MAVHASHGWSVCRCMALSFQGYTLHPKHYPAIRAAGFSIIIPHDPIGAVPFFGACVNMFIVVLSYTCITETGRQSR